MVYKATLAFTDRKSFCSVVSCKSAKEPSSRENKMKRSLVISLIVSFATVTMLSGCGGLRNRIPILGGGDNKQETLYEDPYPSLSKVPSAPTTTSSANLQTIQNGLNSQAASTTAAAGQLASAPTPTLANPQFPSATATQAATNESTSDRLARIRQQMNSTSGQLGNPNALGQTGLPQPITAAAPRDSMAPVPGQLGAGVQPSSIQQMGSPLASPTMTQNGGLPAPTNIMQPSNIPTVDLATARAGGGLSTTSTSGSTSAGSSPNELATIYFQNGSSNLSRRDTLILKDVAKILQQRGGALGIVGHSSKDGKTSEEVNKKMSAKRAAIVARYLVEQIKVPKEMVKATAVGTARQIPGGADYNRRVQILLLPRQ